MSAMSAKMKIRKGDQVVVIAGRDRGKKGEVVRVLPSENRVVVQGVNMIKRHTRSSRTEQGGIVEREAAIHASNVALLDPKSGNATKIGFKTLDDGSKVRFARASGEVIDR
jgi:large subunit ribosomal protein L24